MNFQRNGIDRLNKIKANLDRSDYMFEQLRRVHAECLMQESTYDKNKTEPELPFTESSASSR